MLDFDLVNHDGVLMSFRDVSIDPNGKIVTQTKGSSAPAFTTSNHLEVTIDDLRLDEEFIENSIIHGSGTVRPVSTPLSSISPIYLKDLELMATSSGIGARGKNPDAAFTYTLFGAVFKGLGFSTGYNKDSILYDWSNIDSSLIQQNCISLLGFEVDIGPLRFSNELEVYIGDDVAFKDVDFTWQGFKCRLTEFNVTNLQGRDEYHACLPVGTLIVWLPESFGGMSIKFKYISNKESRDIPFVYRDGESQEVSFGSVSFDIKSVYIEQNGIILITDKISIPTPFGETPLDCNVRIWNDGKDWRAEGYYYPNAISYLLGMSMRLGKIDISEDGVAFSGSMYLPESLPGELSGRGVAAFVTMKKDGSDFRLEIQPSGPMQTVLGGKWSAIMMMPVASVEGENVTLVFNKLHLIFPYEMNMSGDIEASGLLFDLRENKIVYDGMKLDTSATVTYRGITLNLEGMQVSPELNFRFSGTAFIEPGQGPAELASKQLKLNLFEIDRNGMVKGLYVQTMDGTVWALSSPNSKTWKAEKIEVSAMYASSNFQSATAMVFDSDGNLIVYDGASGAFAVCNPAGGTTAKRVALQADAMSVLPPESVRLSVSKGRWLLWNPKGVYALFDQTGKKVCSGDVSAPELGNTFANMAYDGDWIFAIDTKGNTGRLYAVQVSTGAHFDPETLANTLGNQDAGKDLGLTDYKWKYGTLYRGTIPLVSRQRTFTGTTGYTPGDDTDGNGIIDSVVVTAEGGSTKNIAIPPASAGYILENFAVDGGGVVWIMYLNKSDGSHSLSKKRGN